MTTAVQRPPARGSSAPAGQRLASTVRLPWLIGLGSLLTLAVVIGLLSGRGSAQAGVQRATLNAQQAAAVGSAQQVRRSLNEASDDLLQVARVLDAEVVQGPEGQTVPTELAVTALRATAEWHFRYLSLALVDAEDGRSVLSVPGEPPPAPLGPLPDDRRLVAVLDDGRLVESVPIRPGSDLLVAAVYDPAYLYPDLIPRPDAAYVVDQRQRAVAAPGATGLTEPLPTSRLREAAELAGERAGVTAHPAGPALATVYAHAPVEGVGPAGQADLGVVLVRQVSTGGAPASYRVVGSLAALLLALVTLLLFRWLHVALIRPLVGVQQSAERVAYGDLSRPIEVDRYDEIGSTGRALERLRLALIRAQVQDMNPRGGDR